MDLQNGYKVIYEKIANGERTFFADKLDGTKATKLGDAIKVGKYKLVFEKDGNIFGSETGAVKDGTRLDIFDEVLRAANESAEQANVPNEPEQTAAVDNGVEEPEVGNNEEPDNGEGDEGNTPEE